MLYQYVYIFNCRKKKTQLKVRPSSYQAASVDSDMGSFGGRSAHLGPRFIDRCRFRVSESNNNSGWPRQVNNTNITSSILYQDIRFICLTIGPYNTQFSYPNPLWLVARAEAADGKECSVAWPLHVPGCLVVGWHVLIVPGTCLTHAPSWVVGGWWCP